MKVMKPGFYTLKCGCVKYTNAQTTAVKLKLELASTWMAYPVCATHKAEGLSGYEELLRRLYLESIED